MKTADFLIVIAMLFAAIVTVGSKKGPPEKEKPLRFLEAIKPEEVKIKHPFPVYLKKKR